jgi:hypothetical protein
VHSEAWSLPLAARKGRFVFSVGAMRALLEEWRGLHDNANRK